jgi:hypothetical protein
MSHTITLVDKPVANGTAVPEELALELKDTATKLAANPLQVARVEFTDASDVALFVKQAKSWATTNGYVFRKQTAKNQPANLLQFVLVTEAVAKARAEKLAQLKAAKLAKDEAAKNAKNAPKPAAPARRK